MNKNYLKEPYEIVAAKMELADIGLELIRIRAAKVSTIKDLMDKEETLDKQFTAKAKELEALVDKLK